MHQLARQVRFSINPFLATDAEGCNSFASRPGGDGLAIFFELGVELVGEIDPATGFFVNVTDVDKNVRQYVVPVFAERIRKDFQAGRHIGFLDLAELLRISTSQLSGKFGKAMLGSLSLKLNPFRKMAIDCEDLKMVYFSEKFEFSATHKLWNDEFSESRNFEVFGKCANPSGHGHNYVVEVVVKMATGSENFNVGEFERIVNDELIGLVDHKNLNVDVAEFGEKNPTIENITVFAWDKLNGRFGELRLHSVVVWETDKSCCTYYG